ncbi:hypothetical protein FE243_07115 [Aliarcobacter thereius]|uniref:Collagen triple helix repeat (20 copies) n=1 Tax=Aliarcobacter thereius TaxID=544718 RepID=A0A5R9GZ64_9BACT|nr:hypothetical protein [Aliarcobacter thereius]TLS71059.1 hypothetical protein FE246_08840 [Aliarcobacter thereius]TLT06663.1 hypothetical protein FE243_07115 [Aliarcobacter thereius]
MKILLICLLLFSFSNANKNIIQLRLIDSIAINKSSVARANFVSLGSNASSEFRRAIFQGNINYEKLSNGETRTTIVWSRVIDGQKGANVSPFLTKVSTRANLIAGGTILKATGNTEDLTNAIRNMSNDKGFNDTSKDLLSSNGFQEDNSFSTNSGFNSTEDENNNGGFSDNSGYITNGSNGNDGYNGKDGSNGNNWSGGSNGNDGYNGKDGNNGSSGSNGSNGSNGGNSGGGNITPPVILPPDKGGNGSNGSDGNNGKDGSNGNNGNSSYDKVGKCPPLIENGIYTVSEYVDGTCVPTTMSSSIYTTAQGCPQDLNFDKNIATISTRTFAMPMGSEILVTPCQKTTKTANLIETHNGCEWKANLDNETANLQKRYYFNYDGEPVYVTQCVNSNKTAPIEQFKGDLGCQPNIDWNGGTYQETASENGLCRPFGDMQKIYYDEEQCPAFPDFEKSSVTIATIPYINKETGRKYIGACQKTNKTESIKWTNETCTNIIDRKRKVGIEQHRAYYSQNGQKKWLNECGNSENTFELLLYKEYDQACKNKVDYVNLEVYENYRTLTRLDDKTIEVEGCKYEPQRQELKSTYEGCRKRNDFQNKTTYEQERFYFMKDGDRQYVSECRDSNISYKHYNTRATCDLKNNNGKVIVFERNAINLYDGTIEYISECRPISDEIKIEQEFVGYEHDFANGQSYRLIRDYYIDPITKVRNYLTNQVRDNVNFTHIKEAGNWEHDDNNKRSQRKLRIHFTDSVIKKKIYPNGEGFQYSEPVAYSMLFVGERTDNKITNASINSIRKNETGFTYNGILLDTSTFKPFQKVHLKEETNCWTGYRDDDTSTNYFNGIGKYSYGCLAGDLSHIKNSHMKNLIINNKQTVLVPFDIGSVYYHSNIDVITNISEYLRIDGTKLTITNSTKYKAVP